MSEALRKAKLKLLGTDAFKSDDTTTAPKKRGRPAKKLYSSDYLKKAFETAKNCTSVIPAEEERINKLVDEITANKHNDKYWEVRVNYHLSNLEIMKKTYPIFEEEAVRRESHILSVNRKGLWEEEKEKCKADTFYWFDNYAWTADPRKTGIWALPFMLYPFQREAVSWLEDLIFLKKTSGLIEKSRDLGLSWLITALFYKHWQHPRDGVFSALMGSITSDECDKMGDPSSMFEKLRIQARLQPLGLLPKGWNQTIPYMKAINPENGSTITGETSNADFGRSGRYKVILFDEFSAFEFDTAAMTASSQSSPCKIYNSTARGMDNEFYRLAHSGTVEKKTFHWTVHPYKDIHWYEYQKLEMNPVQVAQELDINYDASQPNKVYYNYKEPIHIVTKSEVMRALPDFKDKFGKFRIPFGHKIVMGEDVGQTQEHAHVMLWAVVLKEGTKTVDGIDLSGHVLWYRELVQPPHSPPRIWAESIKKAEGMYEPKMIDVRYISHEADTEIEVYWDEYNLAFEKWKPDYHAGISRVRDYLDVVKLHEPHPFREHTRKLLYPDGEPFMGRPHMFFVVDDEQGELKLEKSTGRYYLTPATDSGGFRRTRFEFPAYHYPTSELGKEVKKMRPKKKDDDAMDVIRCIASEYFAPINPKTEEEKWEEYLPVTMRRDNINKTPVHELGMLFLQREELKKQYEESRRNAERSYREKLWDIAKKY